MSKYALEKNKLFPFIAWTVCIGFSLFVYTIVEDLKDVTRDLEETTSRLETNLSMNPDSITDFRR